MKDKIVVIGGGGHALDVISTIKKNDDYEIIGYTDPFDKGPLLGVKYLGSDDVLNDIFKEHKNCNAAIGIGIIDISNERQTLFDKFKKMGCKFPVIISKTAIVNEEVSIGEGSVIFDRAIINVRSKVGKFSIINYGAIIGHNCSIGDFVHISGGSIVAGGVEIGHNCIIGVGAKIIQNKKIINNCLLGVGSVTITDLLKPGTYFGVPSRRMNID